MISLAAVRVIAANGLAGLTHRLVARSAGVSLAATTYHYRDKNDIIAAAAASTLNRFETSFSEASAHFRQNSIATTSFPAYFTGLIRAAAGRERPSAICWGEVMLDAARKPQNQGASRVWFRTSQTAWTQMIDSCGLDSPGPRAVGSIDILIGLFMIIVGLGLSDAQVIEAILGNSDILGLRHSHDVECVNVVISPQREKSAATRSKILEATIEMLKSEGVAAVTRRSVAASAGLTKAAPFYHYSSIAGLLAEAQDELFRRSKNRYRIGLDDGARGDIDFDHLIDRTAAIFLREATEFAGEAIATYSIWLRADAEQQARAMIWEATADQVRSWRGVLLRWQPTLKKPSSALLAQALFMGKLIRVLATGSQIADLTTIRREFAFGLKAILDDEWFPGAFGTIE